MKRSISCMVAAIVVAGCGSQPSADLDGSEHDAGDVGDASDGTLPDDADADGDPEHDVPGDDDVPDNGADSDPEDSTDRDAVGDAADAPSWTPVYDEFGDVGWRDSDVPRCVDDDGSLRDPSGIWADERGVFLLEWFSESGGVRLLRNSGTGWVAGAEVDLAAWSLDRIVAFTGEPNGSLYATTGDRVLELSPDGAGANTLADLQNVVELAFAPDSAPVGRTRSAPGVVTRLDGAWQPYAGAVLPFDTDDLTSIWALGETVFVGGVNGTIARGTGDAWTIEPAAVADPIVVIAGTEATGLFAGTSKGQILVREGDGWSDSGWTPPSVDAPCLREEGRIRGAWTGDDAVFFFTAAALIRASGTSVETVASWTGVPGEGDRLGECVGRLIVEGIAGIADNELFLLISETDEVPRTCSEYVLYWDGTEFHWF